MVENGIVLRDDCVVPPQAEVDETGRLTGNILYVETADISADAIRIVESAQSAAYRAVNVAMVWRNWLLGRRIAVEEFKGEDRAEYGKEVIKTLARTIADAGYKGLNASTSTTASGSTAPFRRLFTRCVSNPGPFSLGPITAAYCG